MHDMYKNVTFFVNKLEHFCMQHVTHLLISIIQYTNGLHIKYVYTRPILFQNIFFLSTFSFPFVSD